MTGNLRNHLFSFTSCGRSWKAREEKDGLAEGRRAHDVAGGGAFGWGCWQRMLREKSWQQWAGDTSRHDVARGGETHRVGGEG